MSQSRIKDPDHPPRVYSVLGEGPSTRTCRVRSGIGPSEGKDGDDRRGGDSEESPVSFYLGTLASHLQSGDEGRGWGNRTKSSLLDLWKSTGGFSREWLVGLQ